MLGSDSTIPNFPTPIGSRPDMRPMGPGPMGPPKAPMGPVSSSPGAGAPQALQLLPAFPWKPLESDATWGVRQEVEALSQGEFLDEQHTQDSTILGMIFLSAEGWRSYPGVMVKCLTMSVLVIQVHSGLVTGTLGYDVDCWIWVTWIAD